MQDAATWVAFNLPVGTVMTLCDNFTATNGDPIMVMKNLGRCIDLVGTGQPQGVDLTKVNMNDCVSSFFWRTVDLGMGAIELYEDANFGGNRNVLFLSEWDEGKLQSITGWYLEDRVSSVIWNTLDDRQTASLYANGDGSGVSYNNIKGWGSVRQITDLSTVSFNDTMSSFQWNGLAPKKEVIAPFTLDLHLDTTGAQGLRAVAKGVNNASTPLPVQVSFDNQTSQTLTVTQTDTFVVGTSVSYEQSWSVGAGTDSTGGKLTLTLTFTYTHSTETTTTVTNSVGLNITETASAPPFTSYTCVMTAQVGKVPMTNYTTTAQRWYDQQLPGSTLDPSNGWYVRTESVHGTITGGLACDIVVNMDAPPLPGHTSESSPVTQSRN